MVKPLLLYYGVNALTRGLLLFISRARRVASLKPSHGISSIDWHRTLSAGVSGLPDLQVRFEKSGTFSELTEVTANEERAYASTQHRSPRLLRTLGSQTVPENATATTRELMARIPRLRDLYEQTFDELPAAYRADILLISPSDAIVSIFGSFRRLPAEDRIRSDLRLGPEIAIQVEQNHPVSREANLNFRLPCRSRDDLLSKLPPITEGDMEEPYILAPFRSGIALSLLSVYYASAFVVGMLARYHPVHWLDLVGRSTGDLAYPLARETIHEIEAQFPERIVNELVFLASAA